MWQPFLAGLTSQTEPMLVRMSPDRTTVAHVYSTLQLNCTSGGVIFLPDNVSDVHVSTLRHFSQTFSIPPTTSGATSIAISGSFRGQVDRTGTRVSGTTQMTVVQRDPTTNAVADTCASGVVTFSAHR